MATQSLGILEPPPPYLGNIPKKYHFFRVLPKIELLTSIFLQKCNFVINVEDPPHSGGEAVLLQLSDFTKDPMHDFNRLFC